LIQSPKRWYYAVWVVVIGVFAVLHALNLRADFPNHSPWSMDWAKYTDEGWYGNAAVRAHLFGNWYLPGDFNPAPAVPVWPFLEWILFFFTGVTVEAARGLAIAFFFASLVLSYTLLRARGPRWMALLALTLLVTSPFLYCFSRLAILEPMLTTLTLAGLNLAIRLPGFRKPVWISAGIGLLFTLMMLTKTTAVFLLPALGWAMVLPLWRSRGPAPGAAKGGIGSAAGKLILRCVLAASGAFTLSFGLWLVLVARLGLWTDYKYLFFVNKYPKPQQIDWPLVSLWWSFHGGLWIDHILIPLAGVMVVVAVLAWRSGWARKLLLDPVFGASVLAVGGYIVFMTYQDHPQPRYYAVIAFFSFFILAQGMHAMVGDGEAAKFSEEPRSAHRVLPRWLGWAALALAGLAAGIDGAVTLDYATHPEYTFVDAAARMARYIDKHPNGRRLLLSVSGDEITLVTHLPTINDLFVTPSPGIDDLAGKVGYYRPGWYASWNVLDPGMLEDIHSHCFVEQVAKFQAFDDPSRNVLVLFKLHPWPNGQVYDPADQNLRIRYPEDKFDIPLR
jgi:Dolichyl-phosphate-mannose-protein mannosyltransferase